MIHGRGARWFANALSVPPCCTRRIDNGVDPAEMVTSGLHGGAARLRIADVAGNGLDSLHGGNAIHPSRSSNDARPMVDQLPRQLLPDATRGPNHQHSHAAGGVGVVSWLLRRLMTHLPPRVRAIHGWFGVSIADGVYRCTARRAGWFTGCRLPVEEVARRGMKRQPAPRARRRCRDRHLAPASHTQRRNPPTPARPASDLDAVWPLLVATLDLALGEGRQQFAYDLRRGVEER